MLDFPLMLQVKLPVVEIIHPQSNKFAMCVVVISQLYFMLYLPKPLHPKSALIDFTLSNIRRFYSV